MLHSYIDWQQFAQQWTQAQYSCSIHNILLHHCIKYTIYLGVCIVNNFAVTWGRSVQITLYLLTLFFNEWKTSEVIQGYWHFKVQGSCRTSTPLLHFLLIWHDMTWRLLSIFQLTIVQIVVKFIFKNYSGSRWIHLRMIQIPWDRRDEWDHLLLQMQCMVDRKIHTLLDPTQL